MVDPNWIMAVCAIFGTIVGLGGALVWLTAIYIDIKFVKKAVTELKRAKHEDRDDLNCLNLRVYVLEDKLGLPHP